MSSQYIPSILFDKEKMYYFRCAVISKGVLTCEGKKIETSQHIKLDIRRKCIQLNSRDMQFSQQKFQ